MSEAVRCTGVGCDALILWRFTENGKRMPLNAEPTQETGSGVYVLNGGERCEKYVPLLHQDRPRYLVHWATCPDRDRFKRTKSRRS